jgi:hypothetical protein
MQRKMIGLLAGGLLAATSVGLSAQAAAAAPQTLAPPGFYQVFGTDGTLAVQSQPFVGHVIGSVPEGDLVDVMCQINTGGTADGIPSHTWDEIGTNAWVYDHYIATPPQDRFGWSLNTGCNGENPH